MDIRVNGPRILFEIPVFGGIQITQSIMNTWLLMAVITLASVILTRGMRLRKQGRRQLAAETIVKAALGMVSKNAGTENINVCAFASSLFALALFSGIMGAIGIFAPPADLSTCLGWSITAFAAITIRRIRKQKITGYIRSFAQPYALMTPINIISEISLPVSMAFRMFGNIASGAVVMLLLHAALGGIIFRIGIPALFSIYFDIFSSALQAFIMSTLTLIYIRLADE